MLSKSIYAFRKFGIYHGCTFNIYDLRLRQLVVRIHHTGVIGVRKDSMGLSYREMFSLSLFIGCIFATMGLFLAIFAGGVDQVDLVASGRIGAIVGVTAATVIFTYGAVSRLLGKEKQQPVDRKDRLEALRSILHLVEIQAVTDNSPWSVGKHVTNSAGTPTIDLHEIDIRGADTIVNELLRHRDDLGRIRLIIGSGRGSESGGVDLTVAEHVASRLRRSSSSHRWQYIEKKSNIMLRPMGRPPSRGEWIRRFAIGVFPIAGSLALAFRDLAGSAPGAGDTGFIFGLMIGLLVTSMMASHRDRTG